MPIFMAKMGLDTALTMLTQQVRGIDKEATRMDTQLDGMVKKAHKSQDAALQRALAPLKHLFASISYNLKKGGAQTKSVLKMAGLQEASKAYEASVVQAEQVLKSLQEACTSGSGEALDQCSTESAAFKDAYPKIMEEFLKALGDDLLDSVA